MRGLVLLLRTRSVILTCGVGVLVAALIAAYGTLQVRPAAMSAFVVTAYMLLPFLPAVFIGVAAGAPTWPRERGAYLRMGPRRALSVLAQSTFSCAAISLACTIGYGSSEAAPIAIRNFGGFLALTILASYVIGPTLAWIVPLLALILPAYAFFDVPTDQTHVLTFYAQPAAQTQPAIAVAVAILLAFAALVAREPNRSLVARFSPTVGAA